MKTKEERKPISEDLARAAATIKLLAMFLQDYDPLSFDFEPDQIHGLGNVLLTIGWEIERWDGEDMQCSKDSCPLCEDTELARDSMMEQPSSD
jgi:hypothetical protein